MRRAVSIPSGRGVPRAIAKEARFGFTLIELLVVIAIIAILASILFPVFAAAQERARKIACMSNLKVIGMAIRASADSNNGVLPTALVSAAPDSGQIVQRTFLGGQPASGVRQHWGWMYQILPYDIDDERWSTSSDTLVAGTPIKQYECPSRGVNRVLDPYRSGVGERAISDYAGNAGTYLWGHEVRQSGDGADYPGILPVGTPNSECVPHNGVFVLGRQIIGSSVRQCESALRYSDIRDGHSNVIMVAEKALDSGLPASTPRPGHVLGFTAGFPDSANGGMVASDTVRSAFLQPRLDRAGVAIDGFGSAHPDTFNVLFVDGSVVQRRYDIALSVWRQLANRSDRAMIDPRDLE